MLPVLEGVIARRILLNFRVCAEVVRPLVPEPLEVATQNGFAVVGVCLIRLEQLRPKGTPAMFGLASENMAHRIAIRYPAAGSLQDGVYIWRRETDQSLVSLLGGRLFPGVHQTASFHIAEGTGQLEMEVRTADGKADVSFSAQAAEAWKPTRLFATSHDASEFFRGGDCGFSCTLHGEKLEGLRLRTLRWEMAPLCVSDVRASFFENLAWFPDGSVQFDCALLMRGIPHEWYELDDVPELAILSK